MELQLFFYNLFLNLYHAGIRIASAFNPKARLWIKGRRSIFNQLENAISSNSAPIIWMHCSSLGEFEQGRPLLEMIKETHPSYKLMITFFSPSGYEIRKNYEGADYVFYLPADSRKNARRFVKIVKPALVLWVKYDYWYYYLSTFKQKNIPVLLISGLFRMDQPFFKWYGKLHRQMLESFRHLFVQTEASAQLLKSIGFENNVTIVGDTRFDRVLQLTKHFETILNIEEFCGNDPVIVAGSTWIEDEEELDHYANTYHQIKFIIAPHDVSEERLKEVEALFKNCVRYSMLSREVMERNQKPEALIQQQATASGFQTNNVLLIDNIGMLSRLYKYATICYIGGGFGYDGVHNVLEAAVYGKPVIFGPEYEKYIEAVELIEKGAAFSIESAVEIEQLINDMLGNREWLNECGKAAEDYVKTKAGATKAILSFIQVNRLLIS